jgi:MraZ protein
MPDALPAATSGLFLGEWSRTLDERFRLSLPGEWAQQLTSVAAASSPEEAAGDPAQQSRECVLAKELPGCISLWNRRSWETWLAAGIEVIASKVRSGRLDRKIDDVQQLGRLLSTRHRTAPIAGRGRVAVPESFREFLGVDPGGELLVVGAGVCVEVWHPRAWSDHIGARMPGFRSLFEELAQ